MKIGYERVSTADQNDHLKMDALKEALKAAGCRVSIIEPISGCSAKRPELDSLLSTLLQQGSVLVVRRLDSLGRSLPHLIEVLRLVEARGADFISLAEEINTTNENGRLFFHMIGALAEFQRSLIVERAKAGLIAARIRGAKLGRPRSIPPEKMKHAQKLIDQGESASDVARTLGVNRSTLYRCLKENSL